MALGSHVLAHIAGWPRLRKGKTANLRFLRRVILVSTGIFNNVNQLTALSGGWVVRFTGTTTEEAAVTVGGQVAQTSQVSTRFEKAVTLPAGTNTVTVAAVDPSGNTNSKNYRVVVGGGAAQSFTYDANGNMTSDGSRTYAWDAENILIKITEGTKTTDLEYDGFHHGTRILERNGATTLSDRRFIWDGNTLVEQRNWTSTTAAQRYFPQGVQQGTNKFFYTRDHLGSIREVVNNSGSVVARYDYAPYGRRTKLSGTFDSDFGFTGHYFHAPSGLHFAPFRAYSAEFGRWLSRDPIGEAGGINLYGYVFNNPVNLWDPWGLYDVGFYGAGGNTEGNAALRDYVEGRGGKAYDRTQKGQQQAMDDIKKAREAGDNCLTISGYSWGTRAARDLVNKLKEQGIDVDQLNLVDPVNQFGQPGSITVPDNVKSADNYYQTSGGPFNGGPAANPGPNVRNHDMSGPGVDHNNIVGNSLK
jgi:RHS repeat-associated protein